MISFNIMLISHFFTHQNTYLPLYFSKEEPDTCFQAHFRPDWGIPQERKLTSVVSSSHFLSQYTSALF